MGEIAASIAHEINQPISGAITNANAALHWLAADPPNVGEVRKSLERIVKDGYRASDVIARVRALARKTPPRKDPLDINEAVGDVLALTERKLQSNGVKVTVRLSRDLPLIRADRTQVQQVICNLVVNGIEAMSSTGRDHRQLSVITGPDSSGIFVEVRDNGAGFQAAERERLFQSFYTTKAGGMGMGLSLSRSIVEAHGGRLSAEPNEPNGAIFRFTLPVEPTTVDSKA
ncbi:MAG: sensor histidine kinase [Pseudomonadota bacterium]|nr:sensor histidine kinase [Pseudomonadota bacterium]